ncbi:MAG TPA: DUF4258 domain-containing protein [Candidatus Hydrogenedentes bacterium]|nr:DUF4258 domain-containing protein [Candidatus Hydrogenedentota bacterium]
MKPIRFSSHALSYVARRGFTTKEVTDAIESSSWEAAEHGRLQCRKEYPFGKDWNGKVYGTKQVRPVFVEEESEIIVVTVYTYYY